MGQIYFKMLPLNCSNVSVQDFNIACSVKIKKLGIIFGTNYSDIWFGIGYCQKY
jgi:cytidine deaminase